MANKKTVSNEAVAAISAAIALPRVGTLLVIADGYLWHSDLPDSPGALLPDAEQKLLDARARADRVVIASFCCNTHAGAQRVRGIIERDLNLPLSNTFDLHTAIGFPLFDDVIGAC